MKNAALILALVLGACNLPPGPLPPDPTPYPDDLTCVDACQRLRQLGCKEAAPTNDGATCEMVCENAQASPSPLPVACISRAITCPAAESCE
jgi:hypothetical protein